MNIMKLADELLLEPFRIGADGNTASVLKNSNAIASAGNSTLEPSASEYPVTCEERYYDAASALLEEHSHLFTHKNANELGEVIQKWIERKDDNYEPSDLDMGL